MSPELIGALYLGVLLWCTHASLPLLDAAIRQGRDKWDKLEVDNILLAVGSCFHMRGKETGEHQAEMHLQFQLQGVELQESDRLSECLRDFSY